MRLLLIGLISFSPLFIRITPARLAINDFSSSGQSAKEEVAKWNDYSEIFQNINAALPELKATFGEKNRDILSLLGDIRSSNEKLEKEWQSASESAWRQVWNLPWNSPRGISNPQGVWENYTMTSKMFLESMKGNLLLLQSVKGEAKEDAIITTLKNVAEDMRIKAAHCQRYGWASLITVTAVTKRVGNHLVEGLEVEYAPAGWADDPAHWRGFPKLSTAVKDLPPGIYIMRAKGQEGKSVEIDGNNTNKQEVELLVP